MALRIVEFFGYSPEDASEEAGASRSRLHCPFLGIPCAKILRDKLVSGACTVRQANSGPVICCPNRLYAQDYRVLADVAAAAFGAGVRLTIPREVQRKGQDGKKVLVFGKRWGKELKLPRARGRGGYFVDWILALVEPAEALKEFVAVEVQSMDTTGNYRAERQAYLDRRPYEQYSPAGVNWENVSKRILPQVIYKGHVLRREKRCKKGMFFVCPSPVYERICERLGRNMLEYPSLQPGSLTFLWYDIGPEVPPGVMRSLQPKGSFTTTVDQVALAFTSPTNLPPANVYEAAIRKELGSR